MDNHPIYAPVLRWRRAEKGALYELPIETKNQIVPIIEFTHPYIFKGASDLRQMLNSVETAVIEITRYWGNAPVYIGTHELAYYIDQSPELLDRIFFTASELSLTVIPVINLDARAATKERLLSIAKIYGFKICIQARLGSHPIKGLASELDVLLSTYNIEREMCDLIVDAQIISDDSDVFRVVANELPNLNEWNRVIFSGGAFPVDLTKLIIPRNYYLPRYDWLAWKGMVLLTQQENPLLFSDYTIQHPIYREFDPGVIPNPSASIRYTADEYWLVIRGRALRPHRNEKATSKERYLQYPAEASLLIDLEEYCGHDFSPGDRYIMNTAGNIQHPGSPESWLKAGFSHHVVYVVNQLLAFHPVLAESREEVESHIHGSSH